VRNPGFFDDHRQEFKKVDDFNCFNGGKFGFSFAPLRNPEKSAVIHFNAAMDAATIPGGLKLDTGLDIKRHGEKQALSASLGNNWATTGKYVHKFDKRTTLKTNVVTMEKVSLELSRKEMAACYQAKLGASAAGSHVTLSHMRSITPLVSAGAEIQHVFDQTTTLNVAGKFKHMFKGPQGQKQYSGHAATVDLSSSGVCDATYTLQIDPNVSFASGLTYNAIKSTSTATAAVRYDYNSFMMQAKVNPMQGTLKAYLESRINPAVSTFFSGQMNHFTGTSQFGLGLQINL